MSILDDLATAFKGGAPSRVPITQGYISPWAMALGHIGTASEFNYDCAVKDAYMANPVAQRAVRIIAESIGGAPIHTENEALSRLVLASCGTQPLLEVIASQMALHGNAYVQILRDGTGLPVELFPLRPDRVTVNAGKDGWPTSYRYQLGEKAINIQLEDEDGWPCLIHLKGFHPLDDHYGAGCLRAAHQAVAIHNAASDWNRALLENAARPSGALVYENKDAAGLTQAQFDRLKEELNEVYQGSSNAGRPMLLEGGLSWQSMSLSPADMDFATLKSAAARDIALAFGVPPMLLGLPGDNTYANYREANRALWRLTLLPLAKRLLDGLMTGLGDWFPGASIAVDLDQVPALSEDRERYWSQISDADFLTNDEKRELLGFAAKGDDQ